ncbi:hypothetical protein D1BOALGB6SA_9263, partial [Olavius sp. associated proteobacterium Delta 1]
MCRTERLCLKPFMPGGSARTPGGDRSAGGWALKSITFLIPGGGWVKIILNQTRLPPPRLSAGCRLDLIMLMCDTRSGRLASHYISEAEAPFGKLRINLEADVPYSLSFS